MPSVVAYPHVVKPPGECARLEKHPRTRVSMIVCDYGGRGWSAEEIVRQYSYLTLAEVHSALAYYYDHQQEIDEEIAQDVALANLAKNAQQDTPTLRKLRTLKEKA